MTYKTHPSIDSEIELALNNIFPHGDGHITRRCVKLWLDKIAQLAFQEGKTHALLGIMTATDVAAHYKISERRARALIKNRHERFGIGMRVGKSWLIHRDELPNIEPDQKYRQK